MFITYRNESVEVEMIPTPEGEQSTADCSYAQELAGAERLFKVDRRGNAHEIIDGAEYGPPLVVDITPGA